MMHCLSIASFFRSILFSPSVYLRMRVEYGSKVGVSSAEPAKRLSANLAEAVMGSCCKRAGRLKDRRVLHSLACFRAYSGSCLQRAGARGEPESRPGGELGLCHAQLATSYALRR